MRLLVLGSCLALLLSFEIRPDGLSLLTPVGSDVFRFLVEDSPLVDVIHHPRKTQSIGLLVIKYLIKINVLFLLL